jgi:hypothetical protein
MGRLIRSSVAISAGVGEATDTDYTPVLNGYLEAIQYTTTLSTGTTILTSTGKIVVQGDESGITYFSLAAGTGSWTYFPRAIAHSSSGGPIGVSTDYNFAKFPICEERVKVLTSGLSTDAAHLGTVVILSEGA